MAKKASTTAKEPMVKGVEEIKADLTNVQNDLETLASIAVYPTRFRHAVRLIDNIKRVQLKA